jgi:hypothetical protein
MGVHQRMAEAKEAPEYSKKVILTVDYCSSVCFPCFYNINSKSAFLSASNRVVSLLLLANFLLFYGHAGDLADRFGSPSNTGHFYVSSFGHQ